MNHYLPRVGRSKPTHDTRAKSNEHNATINNLLQVWRNTVGNKVHSILHKYVPGVRERTKLFADIVYKELNEEICSQPALKFGKACMTVSVTQGVFVGVHIDKSNGLDSLPIVTLVGLGWKHDSLAMGQLEAECRVHLGQILLFRVRLLQHGNHYAVKPHECIGYTGFISLPMFLCAEQVSQVTLNSVSNWH
jgi:hypothetical protein